MWDEQIQTVVAAHAPPPPDHERGGTKSTHERSSQHAGHRCARARVHHAPLAHPTSPSSPLACLTRPGTDIVCSNAGSPPARRGPGLDRGPVHARRGARVRNREGDRGAHRRDQEHPEDHELDEKDGLGREAAPRRAAAQPLRPDLRLPLRSLSLRFSSEARGGRRASSRADARICSHPSPTQGFDGERFSSSAGTSVTVRRRRRASARRAGSCSRCRRARC